MSSDLPYVAGVFLGLASSALVGYYAMSWANRHGLVIPEITPPPKPGTTYAAEGRARQVQTLHRARWVPWAALASAVIGAVLLIV